MTRRRPGSRGERPTSRESSAEPAEPTSAARPREVATSLPRVWLRVRRQDGPERVETRRWEDFEVEATPRMTVAGALAAIAAHPVTRAGARVAPVAWDAACSDVDCGACTLRIDGRPRPACGTELASVRRRGRPLVLEPLAKFPVVRDLVVDRARLGESLSLLGAHLDLESPARAGALPLRSPEVELERVALARCTSCGACLEACPQYGPHSDFVGAAAISRVRYLVGHATGALTRRARVEALMAPGGVADCGKAESCVEACPVEIPLVDSLQVMSRATSRELLFGWLLR